MEKYLRLEFFKRHKFPTKIDGVAFIKSHTKLHKLMVKMYGDIEDYKEQKISEFEKEFGKYESEKGVFLLSVKDKRKERAEEKKDLQKRAMKEEMREEIMMEIEREKEKVFEEKYPDMYLKIDTLRMEEVMGLEGKFLELIKNKKNLNKKQLDEIRKLKKEAEEALEKLVTVTDALKKYEI